MADAAAPAAPAALALTAAVDAAATLGLSSLACIQDGPLSAALLPPDWRDAPRTAAAASLGDLLLASGLRVLATLGLIGCGASGPTLAGAAALHAVVCIWLVVKAGLAVAAVGGDVLGGQLVMGPVTLRVLGLVITDAVGVLFSCILLAQVAAFRRVLRQHAAPDALSALCAPLQPDARAWLQQRAAAREAAVRQWLNASAAGPSSSSAYVALPPGSPSPDAAAAGGGGGGDFSSGGGVSGAKGGSGWLQGWGRGGRPPAAAATPSPPRQQLVAAAAARRAAASAAAAAEDDAAESGLLSRPLLSPPPAPAVALGAAGTLPPAVGDAWGSGSDDADIEFASCTAASRGPAGGSSLAGASIRSFATAPSVEQQEGE